MREVAAPSASFTGAVMARVGQERWQTERVVDLGFNLAIAAGVAGDPRRAARAWRGRSACSASRSISTRSGGRSAPRSTGRVLSQVQTIAMAAVLLTMALVLWWWAEAASD